VDKPLQVLFRGLEPDPDVETAARAEADKLERYFGHVVGCRVTVSMPHRHHRKGNLYHVRVELGLPGEDVVINREPAERHAHASWRVALRDSFDRARRVLEDRVRRMRAQVKAHEAPGHGRVVQIDPLAGLGRIAASDGLEHTFLRSSVLGERFDELEIGAEVRFRLEEGTAGPHATSVQPVGRHHHLT
jgi:cold shock CspA family protein